MTAFDSVHRSAGMTAKCFNQLALRTHASAGKSFASTRLNATLSRDHMRNGVGNWGMFYSSLSDNFVKKIMQQPYVAVQFLTLWLTRCKAVAGDDGPG